MASRAWFFTTSLAVLIDFLTANALDMEAAKGKISDVMLDRLYLDAGRIEAMATGNS